MSFPIGNSSGLKDMYMAEFVISLQQHFTKSGKMELKVLKNRYGKDDEKSIYNNMIIAFTESTYNYLKNNKTEVTFFEESVKEKFKEDLIKFVEDKWREINANQMPKLGNP